ncbi:MAG: hypothetical protein F4Y03_10130 [Alphaproteobacteria bacterium]|nr:hypothetical protein [Alphaproteobacteria bacterium]
MADFQKGLIAILLLAAAFGAVAAGAESKQARRVDLAAGTCGGRGALMLHAKVDRVEVVADRILMVRLKRPPCDDKAEWYGPPGQDPDLSGLCSNGDDGYHWIRAEEIGWHHFWMSMYALDTGRKAVFGMCPRLSEAEDSEDRGWREFYSVRVHPRD